MDAYDAYEARRHVGHTLAVVVEGDGDDTVTMVVCQTCVTPIAATHSLADDPKPSSFRARVTPYTRGEDGSLLETFPPYPDAALEWNLAEWTVQRMSGLNPDNAANIAAITLAVNTDPFLPRWTTQWHKDGGQIGMEIEADYEVVVRGTDAMDVPFIHNAVLRAWDEVDARDLWESNGGEVFTGKGYTWEVASVAVRPY